MKLAGKREARTYGEWDQIRPTGRGGKKKVRRDTTLSKREDGLLEFHYGSELMVTLDANNTYTLSFHDKTWYPTYANIFWLVARVTAYSDMSHFKHYAQPIRVGIQGRRWVNDNGKWERAKTMPFTNGLKYRNGVCLNPEIAVDYKRTLNRTLSLPLLRKTEVLAKVLRVATRMGVLNRDMKTARSFEVVNIDDPTAVDAEIILRMGSAKGLYGWRANNSTPEEQHAALLRCAENGLADYREWLYKKHGCYEMLPVETKGEEQ